MALSQLPSKHPREIQLRDRLLNLAIETQAEANRLRAAGGACMAQSATVNRAAWVLAKAAWHISCSGSAGQEMQTFFPGVGTGKRPEDAPPHGAELEDLLENEHGS